MNNEHLEILKKGVTDWNKWRLDNLDVKPNLSGADLTGANLSGANLNSASLFRANLDSANLNSASLFRANLDSANLNCANLSGANLNDVNLNSANLNRANLNDANLNSANLSSADLTGANLNDVDLFNTIGNGKEIITFQTETYICNFTKEVLWIGCKGFSYDEWFNFSDAEINEFDTKALEFWTKYKEIIFTLKSTYGF